jgi:hypothetical protein
VDKDLSAALSLVAKSMGMPDSESISVSTERTNDKPLSSLPEWQDIQLDPSVEEGEKAF